MPTKIETNKEVCMGCGKKFSAAKLQRHQDDCPRYRLECSLIKAQDKIKV